MTTKIKNFGIKILVPFVIVFAFTVVFISSSASALGVGGLFEFVLFDTYEVKGSSDITVTEVVYALSEYFEISTDEIAKLLEFHVDDDKKCIQVYEDDELVEVVYKNDSGEICGYATGFVITYSDDSVKGLTVKVGSVVDWAFGLLSAGFNFISCNDLCIMMLGISFAGAGLGLSNRALCVARK